LASPAAVIAYRAVHTAAPHPAAKPNPVVGGRAAAQIVAWVGPPPPPHDGVWLQKLEHKVMQERYHFQLNNDHYM